jgi:3-methylcrotonyl-CoA carboxylase alpha subunit
LFGLQFPEMQGLRIDTGIESGSEVTPFYDPMVAKLIAHGKTRTEALDRLVAALEQTIVAGPRSNVGFLAALCRSASVRKGDFDTGFIDANLAELGAVAQGLDRAAAAFGAKWLLDFQRGSATSEDGGDHWTSPWDATDAFQMSGKRWLALPIVADGQTAVAEVIYGQNGTEVSVEGVTPAQNAVAVAGPGAVYVLRHGRQTKVSMRDPALAEAGDSDKSGSLRAPMHGKVLALLVREGAKVARGQRVAIIEAMKMEHTIVAPVDGIVTEIAAAQDSQIAEGALVMQIEPATVS